jgi:hypothetical protein
VVDAAVGISLKKSGDRGIRSQWFQQFNLCIWQSHKCHRDAMFGLRHRQRHLSAKGIGVNGGAFGEVWYSNGDMVQASNHV